MSIDHVLLEEWADGDGDPYDIPYFGPYSEKTNPEWCIICGAPLVTCTGESHGSPEQDPSSSLDHLAEVFRDFDLESAERVAALRRGVQRDLDPDDGDDDFIPFER